MAWFVHLEDSEMAQASKEVAKLTDDQEVVMYDHIGYKRGVIRGRIDSTYRGIKKLKSGRVLKLVDIWPADGGQLVTAFIRISD